MSKTDRDRLVAGRENRGFSYTEESGDGKKEGKEGGGEGIIFVAAVR